MSKEMSDRESFLYILFLMVFILAMICVCGGCARQSSYTYLLPYPYNKTQEDIKRELDDQDLRDIQRQQSDYMRRQAEVSERQARFNGNR